MSSKSESDSSSSSTTPGVRNKSPTIETENPTSAEAETVRKEFSGQDEVKVPNGGPDVLITPASPKSSDENASENTPSSLNLRRMTPKQCVEQVLSRRLVAEGPDGDSKKLTHLSKRVQNFFKICVDPSNSLEHVDARFKEVIGLIHQVKHAGMKDAEAIKTAEKDKMFQKDYSTKVFSQVEETERVIASIKIKIDENQKRSKELQQEKVLLELVRKNPARSEARVKSASIEAEIAELKKSQERLEELLATRKLKLAPLIVAKDNLLELLRREREESAVPDNVQNAMEFGPKCPEPKPCSKETQDLLDILSSAGSSIRSKSASEHAVEDMMDEVLMMNFTKKDDPNPNPISEKIQSMSLGTSSLPSGFGSSSTSAILRSSTGVPEVSPHKLLPIMKAEDEATSSQLAKVSPESTDLEASQRNEEDLLMLSDGEHDESGSHVSNEDLSGYYVVEEELLVSSDSENEIDSVRRDRVEKSKAKAASERAVISEGYRLSIPENPQYANLPLFPTSPKEIPPSPSPEPDPSPPGREFQTSLLSVLNNSEYDTASPWFHPVSSLENTQNDGDGDTPLFPNSPRRVVPECDAPRNPLMSSSSSSDSSDSLAEYEEDGPGLTYVDDGVVGVDAPRQVKIVIPMETIDGDGEEEDVNFEAPEQEENDVEMEEDKKTEGSDVDMDSIYKTLEAMEETLSSSSSPEATGLDLDTDETFQTSNVKASDSSLLEDAGNGNIQNLLQVQPEPNADAGPVLSASPVKSPSYFQSQAGPSGLQEISSSEEEYTYEYSSDEDY